MGRLSDSSKVRRSKQRKDEPILREILHRESQCAGTTLQYQGAAANQAAATHLPVSSSHGCKGWDADGKDDSYTDNTDAVMSQGPTMYQASECSAAEQSQSPASWCSRRPPSPQLPIITWYHFTVGQRQPLCHPVIGASSDSQPQDPANHISPNSPCLLALHVHNCYPSDHRLGL